MNIKYTDNAINILAAKTFPNIGPAWIIKNLKGNKSVETIIQLINSVPNKKNDLSKKLITVDDFDKAKKRIIEILHGFKDSCDGLVAIGDKDFPTYRGTVNDGDQPFCLFYKGNIDLLDISNNNITVIGLLNPDKDIEKREQKIVEEIIKQNITIVSGLAFGCDSIAHRQALKGGKTIAILPSPLNKILPASNKQLAYDIVDQGGLLISEYYDDFGSRYELNNRYDRRDRLQALFCDAIILAASYSKDSGTRWGIFDKKLDSGARLAMKYAKDYNIPRAVMYDKKIDSRNPMFDLNRDLISEQNNIIILTKKTLQEMIDRINSKEKNKFSPPDDLI